MHLDTVAVYIAAVLLIIFISFVLIRRQYQRMFGPGSSPEETALIIVHDYKLGMRARNKAIEYGDRIIPLIRKESSDFAELNGRNSYWIAAALGKIKTDLATATLQELYARDDSLQKLTGTVGLAMQGLFSTDSAVISLLETFQKSELLATESEPDTEMAILALGYTRNPIALPALLGVLRNRPRGYQLHSAACEAIARIGSKEAIPVLRNCMHGVQYYATADAFRVLIMLGDKEAIPLAIKLIDHEYSELTILRPNQKNYNQERIVRALQLVTGKMFGTDTELWNRWWSESNGTWQIPEEFLRPWDDQRDRP